MVYSEQERAERQQRMDRRRRPDYEDVSGGSVGVHVAAPSHLIAKPDGEAMSNRVQRFLGIAGLRSETAIPVGIGATSGGPGTGLLEEVFQFMKPIGLTVQAAKFLLAWRGRVAALKRHELLPLVPVTLLADHIEPTRHGGDMARALILILPELQEDLESEFPACNFRYELSAVGERIARVTVRAGRGLRVTDSHVLQMLKRLEQDVPSLTLFHTEGWFAMPKVVTVKKVVRPIRISPGRIRGSEEA